MKLQYLALVRGRLLSFVFKKNQECHAPEGIPTHLLSTDVCFWMKFDEETFPLKTKFADLCP